MDDFSQLNFFLDSIDPIKNPNLKKIKIRPCFFKIKKKKLSKKPKKAGNEPSSVFNEPDIPLNVFDDVSIGELMGIPNDELMGPNPQQIDFNNNNQWTTNLPTAESNQIDYFNQGLDPQNFYVEAQQPHNFQYENYYDGTTYSGVNNLSLQMPQTPRVFRTMSYQNQQRPFSSTLRQTPPQSPYQQNPQTPYSPLYNQILEQTPPDTPDETQIPQTVLLSQISEEDDEEEQDPQIPQILDQQEEIPQEMTQNQTFEENTQMLEDDEEDQVPGERQISAELHTPILQPNQEYVEDEDQVPGEQQEYVEYQDEEQRPQRQISAEPHTPILQPYQEYVEDEDQRPQRQISVEPPTSHQRQPQPYYQTNIENIQNYFSEPNADSEAEIENEIENDESEIEDNYTVDNPLQDFLNDFKVNDIPIPKRCRMINKNGEACKNKRKTDSAFCGIHSKFEQKYYIDENGVVKYMLGERNEPKQHQLDIMFFNDTKYVLRSNDFEFFLSLFADLAKDRKIDLCFVNIVVDENNVKNFKRLFITSQQQNMFFIDLYKINLTDEIEYYFVLTNQVLDLDYEIKKTFLDDCRDQVAFYLFDALINPVNGANFAFLQSTITSFLQDFNMREIYKSYFYTDNISSLFFITVPLHELVANNFMIQQSLEDNIKNIKDKNYRHSNIVLILLLCVFGINPGLVNFNNANRIIYNLAKQKIWLSSGIKKEKLIDFLNLEKTNALLPIYKINV